MNNDIENISEEQWNDTWKRAELFKTTYIGKQMMSKHNKPGLRMRKGDPIPTQYIMALMIWCNFDTLQRDFRRDCKNNLPPIIEMTSPQLPCQRIIIL